MNTPALWSDRLGTARIVPVVTIENHESTSALAGVFMSAGIRAVEVALRTAAALEALRALRASAPDLLLGAGTILTPAQAEDAMAAGADFGLAPGLDATTIMHCSKIGFPFIPGVATASDIQAALALGCTLLKWFPAESLGGVAGLRTLAAPFVHLGVRFLPLGGITEKTTQAYLAEPAVAAVGGSWIATSELIRRQSWDEIHRRAQLATSLVANSTNS